MALKKSHLCSTLWPSYDELRGVIDAETVPLEGRRDETGAITQGRMQECLTGRSRLTISQEVES